MEEKSNAFMQILLLNELLRDEVIDKNIYQLATKKIQSLMHVLSGTADELLAKELPTAITA